MPIPQDLGGAPAQLTWYIGSDGSLYVRELQTGGRFRLIPLGQDTAPEAGPPGPEGPAGPPGPKGDKGDPGASGAYLDMVSPDTLSTVTLDLVDGGDIVATQITGPNAGKSVNLTYGKWM